MTRRLVSGYCLIVVTALLWAGSWITARAAAHDAPAVTVTLLRFVVASLALLPVWAWLGRGRSIRLDARSWILILLMSATGIATYTVLFMVGVAYAPASDGAVITPGLVGPFTILLAWPLLGERPSRRVVSGTVVSLLGVMLVGFSAVRAAGDGSSRALGDLLFAFGALVWAIYTALGRKLADRVPAVTGILLCSALGAVLLVPAALIWDGVPDFSAWSPTAWINVVYLGIFGTAIAFTTYYLAVRATGVGRAMPALGLVPFFGVLMAALFLNETLTPMHATGGALVIAGIAIPAMGRGEPDEGPAGAPKVPADDSGRPA